MVRVMMLAALSEEHSRLRRRTAPWKREPPRSLPTYRKRFPGAECLLLETGMGRRSIELALERLHGDRRPHLILSFGFAGSLDAELGVGKVGLGERFIRLAAPSANRLEGPMLVAPTESTLGRHASAWGLERVRVATMETVQDKMALARHLGGSGTLVDMETYFAAEAAAALGTAFVSIRSVSDALADAIDFDVGALSDPEGRIRISRVLRQAGRSPRMLLSLGAAWKRSRQAADSLADVLQSLLLLPPEELEAICREQHVTTLSP